MEDNVLIAVPAFGGQIHWRCAATLMALDRLMNEQASCTRSISLHMNL
jgi:hypothetical protein